MTRANALVTIVYTSSRSPSKTRLSRFDQTLSTPASVRCSRARTVSLTATTATRVRARRSMCRHRTGSDVERVWSSAVAARSRRPVAAGHSSAAAWSTSSSLTVRRLACGQSGTTFIPQKTQRAAVGRAEIRAPDSAVGSCLPSSMALRSSASAYRLVAACTSSGSAKAMTSSTSSSNRAGVVAAIRECPPSVPTSVRRAGSAARFAYAQN